MAKNGGRFHCYECDEDYPSAMSLARHFAEFPEHRNHRQQLQWENSQKHTKKKRRLTGRKRSGPYGKVRHTKKKRRKRTKTVAEGAEKKTYPCYVCNRHFYNATHAFQHFQRFPHHRNEKQQRDYERNVGYVESRGGTPMVLKGNGSLPTVAKTTRTRKKKAATSTVMLRFCTACGMERSPDHAYCGGCGVQL